MRLPLLLLLLKCVRKLTKLIQEGVQQGMDFDEMANSEGNFFRVDESIFKVPNVKRKLKDSKGVKSKKDAGERQGWKRE